MLGVCCHWLEPITKRSGSIEYINAMNERSLQFGAFKNGKYTYDYIYGVWINNLSNLQLILDTRIIPSGVKCFRLSSNIFPLADQFKDKLTNSTDITKRLSKIGDTFKNANIRVTTHPSQMTLLSSKRSDVNITSANDLAHHAWIFDTMGFAQSTYYAINIHGGVKNEYDTLINNINNLPINIKNRLTLENDERAYSVNDLYNVYEQTDVPIVVDSHHHNFLSSGICLSEAFKIAKSTWGSVKQLTHLSNTDSLKLNGNFTERRSHSDYIHYIPIEQQQLNDSGEIDIEVEAKMKNLSVFKMVKDFGIKL